MINHSWKKVLSIWATKQSLEPQDCQNGGGCNASQPYVSYSPKSTSVFEDSRQEQIFQVAMRSQRLWTKDFLPESSIKSNQGTPFTQAGRLCWCLAWGLSSLPWISISRAEVWIVIVLFLCHHCTVGMRDEREEAMHQSLEYIGLLRYVWTW
jgi:hypothetical protein